MDEEKKDILTVHYLTDDEVALAEFEDKHEEHIARAFDPLLKYNDLTDDEILEMLWADKEDDDDEKR